MKPLRKASSIACVVVVVLAPAIFATAASANAGRAKPVAVDLCPEASARFADAARSLARDAVRQTGATRLLRGIETASPIGGGQCDGVRPGALVAAETPDRTAFCTFNFLFRDDRGREYAGTAGHCVLGEGPTVASEGEHVFKRGERPIARDADGRRVGAFVYAIEEDLKDLSLIRIDKGVSASPSMCHFGGPTGINRDVTDSPTSLRLFGNGLGVSDVAPARTLFALSLSNDDYIAANGPSINGDSGGPVTTPDGRAVGVLVNFGVQPFSVGLRGTDVGLIGITRLGPQIDRAEKALDLRLRLRKAPLL